MNSPGLATMASRLAAAADRFVVTEELREALSDPALEVFSGESTATPDEAAKAAASRVATALGSCRVFGVDPPEDLDGTLTPAMAIAAASWQAAMIPRVTEDAARLRARWLEAEDEEQIEMCCGTIEFLMEMWASFQVLVEAHIDSVESGSSDEPELDRAVEAVVDALDALDAVLQRPENLALLQTVCSTQLLRNWHQCLDPEYRDVPPWWLDGTLERWHEHHRGSDV